MDKQQKLELPKTFIPADYEAKIYQMWESAGAFQPDLEIRNSDLEIPCFSMVMPPPNANGSLHIGHAVFVTLEDIMVRYHRLKGEPTLWLPGADHAGFETQVVYQKKLEKEGRNWFNIPREELYNEIKEFTLANKENMENQLRRLGASCDWTREKFTLDPEIIKIVYQTFKKLYDDGLVYRDSRIINWCTKHQTTLSDLEVKYEERDSELYEITYKLVTYEVTKNGSREITVATTRPETMFGDVAVAVNPNDKRYQNLIGKTVIQPLTNRELPIIANESVDMKFGTGALKITPVHDATDFEIGKKHLLDMDRQVIDKFGKLSGDWVPIQYRDLKVDDARKIVVEDLEKLGFLTKKAYQNSVAVCYKCQKTIEPMILPQWFIAMTKKTKKSKLKTKNYGVASPRLDNEGKSLKDLGIEAVKNGEVKFVTKKFEKIYLHWLNNLRDWNISRQIVWGIQIPVWYCGNNDKLKIKNVETNHNLKNSNLKIESSFNNHHSEINKCQLIVTDGDKPEKCPTCGETNLTQDEDVFDTWFSSGQWTFAPLLAQSRSNDESKLMNDENNSHLKNSKLELESSFRNHHSDFDQFYPTSVMETGHDIIFFWVARMIMLGKYKTGKAPFKYVYLHGLLRDKDRQKMSKSKGNVVDPLGVIDQYGADALRMAIVFGVSAGSDIVISEEKIKGMRNFSNKVWNIARFAISQFSIFNFSRHSGTPPRRWQFSINSKIQNTKLQTDADKEIINKLEQVEKSVTNDIESFRFGQAAHTLYNFIWHDFADVYIEASKKQLEDESSSLNTCYLLLTTLITSLKLLHPFMPFVTETIWQELYARKLVDDKMLINAEDNI